MNVSGRITDMTLVDAQRSFLRQVLELEEYRKTVLIDEENVVGMSDADVKKNYRDLQVRYTNLQLTEEHVDELTGESA